MDTRDKAAAVAVGRDDSPQAVRGYPVKPADGEAAVAVLRSLFLVVNHQAAYARFGHDARTGLLVAIASEPHHRQIAEVLGTLVERSPPTNKAPEAADAGQSIRVYPIKHIDGEQLVSKLRAQFVVVNHEQAETRLGFDPRTCSLLVIARNDLHARSATRSPSWTNRQNDGLETVAPATKIAPAAQRRFEVVPDSEIACFEATSRCSNSTQSPFAGGTKRCVPLFSISPLRGVWRPRTGSNHRARQRNRKRRHVHLDCLVVRQVQARKLPPLGQTDEAFHLAPVLSVVASFDPRPNAAAEAGAFPPIGPMYARAMTTLS